MTPPQATESEGQVVGSLLIDPTLADSLAKRSGPRDFRDPHHAATIRAIFELRRNGKPVDVLTVKQALDSHPAFTGDHSPAVYLATVGQSVSTVAHFDHHLEEVLEASLKRRIIDATEFATAEARNGKASDEILCDLWASLEDLKRDNPERKERFAPLTAADLDSGDFRLNWLIDWLLVEGQPCIVAGPKKTLKTTLLLAIALALATGNDLLGKWRVRQASQVVYCSGESGLATLQETARRIAKAMGWELSEIPDFIITTDLPRLDDATDLIEFEAFLVEHEAEVVILDPAYLCMGATDNGNLFAQGAILRSISSLCERLGATLILAHHTKRHIGRDPYSPPELEDIAWAGFQEFARQWLLLGRREPYTPGTGEHHLWLSAGGSAGHGGLWALEIAEGNAETPGGRFWQCEVHNATEANQIAQERKLESKQAKLQEQTEADEKAILATLASIKEETKNGIKDATGLRTERFNRAFALAIQEKHITQTTIKKGNNREYDGYKLTDSED